MKLPYKSVYTKPFVFECCSGISTTFYQFRKINSNNNKNVF